MIATLPFRVVVFLSLAAITMLFALIGAASWLAMLALRKPGVPIHQPGGLHLFSRPGDLTPAGYRARQLYLISWIVALLSSLAAIAVRFLWRR